MPRSAKPPLLVVACLVLLALVAACNPSAPASSAAPTAPLVSGIDGMVVAGPTCPVQRAGESPCVRPLAGAVIVVASASRGEVARVTADSTGRFRIPLPAGTYVVRPQPVQGVLGAGREQVVSVPPDRFVSVTVEYDTGIR